MPLRVIQHYSDWVCTAVMSNDVMMYFRVFHRLYSSSAIMAGERDNIAVSSRVLGKYQTQTPIGITEKATLLNML